ncbi:hypothetical protein P9848_05590 [Geobacillus stearothermophilus]|uniref:hypothetical protein n=1 Tax=Geobacillus stearothermophilus TaxID=1422 RepID=UPI002E1A13E2|nr:hypothetical protein [Geobacillus stearothermophilus]
MKNIWKKWWFWAIIAVLFIIGSVNGNDEQEVKQQPKPAVTEEKKEPEKEVSKETATQNDEQSQKMVEQLKEDIRLNYGDADGEKATSWYHHFKGFRIDLDNKIVYIESDLPSSDQENAEHLASAVINTMNFEKEKYFVVEKVIVLDKDSKEMYTKENYQ